MRASFIPATVPPGLALLSLVIGQVAWACPACAGRTQAEGPAALYGLAGMLLLPLFLGGLGVSLARRLGSVHDSEDGDPR